MSGSPRIPPPGYFPSARPDQHRDYRDEYDVSSDQRPSVLTERQGHRAVRPAEETHLQSSTQTSAPRSHRQILQDHFIGSSSAFMIPERDNAKVDDGTVASTTLLAPAEACDTCTMLKPLMTDVVNAVANLHENIPASKNQLTSRKPQCSDNDPVRASQWILERLHSARLYLQEIRHSQQGHSQYEYAITNDSGVPWASSPPGLKRSADPWNRIETPKRLRPADFADAWSYQAARTYEPRRTSEEQAFSVTSVDPRSNSLQMTNSPRRAPLPLSEFTTYPPAVGAQPRQRSPPQSPLQQHPSVNTPSLSADTSAQASELQRQLRSKTSSLQSLTVDHASLLESLQNEKSRCEAIEKKLRASESESQELSSRNEELVDRLQGLELQLDELEKKREVERVNSTQEKEQWGRMLEMGSRLQAKSAEEKQKLVEQISALTRQAATHEDTDFRNIEQARLELSATQHTSSTNDQHPQVWSEARTGITMSDSDSMRRELTRQARLISRLSSALNDVTQRSLDLDDKARQLIQQSSEIRTISATTVTVESPARHRDTFDRPALQRSASSNAPALTMLPLAGTDLEPHTMTTTRVGGNEAVATCTLSATDMSMVALHNVDVQFPAAVTTTSKELTTREAGSISTRGAASNIHAAYSDFGKLTQSDSYHQECSGAWAQPLDATWSLGAAEQSWPHDQLALRQRHSSSMGSYRSMLSDSAGTFTTASSPSTDCTIPGLQDELAASNPDNHKTAPALEVLQPPGDGFYNGIFKHLPARPVLPRQISANDQPYRGYDAVFRP